ncbi:MAG: radical SAM family heme chaperone HemW [Planctomycetota bacterium]|nr:radical SAM family heme chaperone HemW [Planctomycetota bacterium]
MDDPTSLYLHVPFCRHRCGYCNFTLMANRQDLVEDYLKAIAIEIRKSRSATLETLFLGGGTPTRLNADQFHCLMDILEERFELADELEMTVEANPADISEELVSTLVSRGVNRISLGVQSFRPEKLEFLERDHDSEGIRHAVDTIRSRIENLSIDLIFGTRDETPAEWMQDLAQAIRLQPRHLSTYSLTVEKGTRFWNRQQKDERMQVDDESTAELYELGIDYCEDHQFEHYEVSNFAQAGYQCRHNLNYWNGGSYFGFGPGAARFLDGVRSTNHQSTTSYLKRVLGGQDPTSEVSPVDREQWAREILIFGLRRRAGIDLDEFQERTGFSLQQLVGSQLAELLENNLLEIGSNRIWLTRRGLLVSDSIWPRFL